MKHKNAQLIFAFLLALLSFSSNAQRVITSEEEPKQEKSTNQLSSRIWYGGGFQLGFSSYYGGNVFAFGLSPMVGYKIIEPVSIGPRVEMTYTSFKQPGFKAVSLFDVDAGVFLRFRVFRGLFLQGELSNSWLQQAVYGSQEKVRTQRFNQRIGAGWNFGNGQAGSELGVFYNFAIANDLYAYENPLGYRFGFTWNF
ncbi:MAG: hypothetical protein R3A50_05160 [Saprospiraceae bacterium]|nr:hypothetical protein [Saprospiraceae bacterium]MCB9342438.1 hypothetical protein [Lewinellaceae bacterium]